MDVEPLLAELDALEKRGAPVESLLEAAISGLHRLHPRFHWTGLYELYPDQVLRLGPFVGAPTDHVFIGVGRGVCGTAVAEKRNMNIPDSLQTKLALFRSRALVTPVPGESFTEASWVAILIGQNVLPRCYDPIIDGIDLATLQRGMAQRRAAIRQAAEAMPLQSEFIARNCAAPC